MISRYDVAEISKLWTDEGRFGYYLEVELAHLRTLEESGLVPKGLADKMHGAKIDPARISEIEKTTGHDVIAFCTSITEQFAPEDGRFFHFGITSSDVIDTAHALLMKDSMKVIEKDIAALSLALSKKAQETSDLLCIGRSHGIHAEAMIFGQKFLSFYAELKRREKEWHEALNDLTGQLSGAVGNYTVVTPEFEESTLKKLGLKVEPVSTQVIPRDRYAKIIGIGALMSSLFDRMATEFRLLQHSDVDELREGFSKGQKGSSTMPHKKNPISSENIAGLSRLLRSHIIPALENCALWHERDISHSSVERMMLPDHFGLLSYALRRMTNVVENLVIDRVKIEEKVEQNEKIYSSYVLHQLIQNNTHTKREELYEVVQEAFFKSKNKETLKTNLAKGLDSKKLTHEVSRWIDFNFLKNHYQEQFKKIAARTLVVTFFLLNAVSLFAGTIEGIFRGTNSQEMEIRCSGMNCNLKASGISPGAVKIFDDEINFKKNSLLIKSEIMTYTFDKDGSISAKSLPGSDDAYQYLGEGKYTFSSSYRASFPCQNASNKSERAICSSEILSSLDLKLSVTYKAYLEKGGKTAAQKTKTEQKSWVETRNSCKDDLSCLQKSYEGRILALTN